MLPWVMWVSFLFHPWWRQFAWILLQWTHFHELSVIEIQFGWFQIDSIGFHGFRSTRNNIHGYWMDQTNSPGKPIHKHFTFFHNLPSTDFVFKDFQSMVKFLSQLLEGFVSEFSLMELIFIACSWPKLYSLVYLTMNFNSVVFPWRISIFIVFHQWSLFL